MRSKRIWQVSNLALGAVAIRCDVASSEGEPLRAVNIITPLDRRRIDYDPWRIILHLSRMMDALEGAE